LALSQKTKKKKEMNRGVTNSILLASGHKGLIERHHILDLEKAPKTKRRRKKGIIKKKVQEREGQAQSREKKKELAFDRNFSSNGRSVLIFTGERSRSLKIKDGRTWGETGCKGILTPEGRRERSRDNVLTKSRLRQKCGADLRSG